MSYSDDDDEEAPEMMKFVRSQLSVVEYLGFGEF